MTTNDPAALFRAMLGEWEKMANSLGGDLLKSDEWARTMHGAQGATLNAQAAYRAMSQRVLAGADIPSRSELEDLSVRIGGIEASLRRIETLLTAGTPPARASAPKPTRTRKPPEPLG